VASLRAVLIQMVKRIGFDVYNEKVGGEPYPFPSIIGGLFFLSQRSEQYICETTRIPAFLALR